MSNPELDPEIQAKIAGQNDLLRSTFSPCYGKVVFSRAFADLDVTKAAKALAEVQGFKLFTEDNDPYGEHDCASMEVFDETVMFKIDYYQKGCDFMFGAKTPEDPETVERVLTIMLSSDY